MSQDRQLFRYVLSLALKHDKECAEFTCCGKEFHKVGPWLITVNFFIFVLQKSDLKLLLWRVWYEWNWQFFWSMARKVLGYILFSIEYINKPSWRECISSNLSKLCWENSGKVWASKLDLVIILTMRFWRIFNRYKLVR